MNPAPCEGAAHERRAWQSPEQAAQYAPILLLGHSALGSALATELLRDGVQLTCVQTLAQAELCIAAHPVCLALLELDPGSCSGAAALKAFRRADIPAIVLGSGADLLAQRIAFLLGANDFATTSEGAAYLAGRVRFFLRRHRLRSTQRLMFGGLELDLTRPAAWAKGSSLDLTLSEYLVLAALLKAQGQTVSRDQLVVQVRGHAKALPLVRSIDAHVRALRRKLHQALGADPIVAVRSRGYRLATEPVPATLSLAYKALQSLAEPVLILDTHARVSYANDAAQACIGRSAAAIEGLPCAGVLGCPAGSAKPTRCLGAAAVATGMAQTESHWICPQQTGLGVIETVSPLPDTPGYVVLQLQLEPAPARGS